MRVYRHPVWSYPLFQIPLILLGLCLLLALLFWFLGIGRPNVSVAIALDLGSSTYDPQSFNASGTIMDKEVKAVKAYLNQNTAGLLGQPNQIQVFGFADEVYPLTRSFQNDNKKIKEEIDQAIQPELVDKLGGGKNLDAAIEEGTSALSDQDSCRELLIVTDGAVSVNSQVVKEAKENRVKINAVIIGTDAPDVENATIETGGKYLSGEEDQLNQLFTDQLYGDFNNNWRWILLWLGLAWICGMWVLVLPLDRWLFQGLLKMPTNLSGRLALGNAFFWSAATPLIIWKLYQLFELASPFFGQC